MAFLQKSQAVEGGSPNLAPSPARQFEGPVSSASEESRLDAQRRQGARAFVGASEFDGVPDFVPSTGSGRRVERSQGAGERAEAGGPNRFREQSPDIERPSFLVGGLKPSRDAEGVEHKINNLKAEIGIQWWHYREKKVELFLKYNQEFPIQVCESGHIPNGNTKYHLSKTLGISEDQLNVQIVESKLPARTVGEWKELFDREGQPKDKAPHGRVYAGGNAEFREDGEIVDLKPGRKLREESVQKESPKVSPERDISSHFQDAIREAMRHLASHPELKIIEFKVARNSGIDPQLDEDSKVSRDQLLVRVDADGNLSVGNGKHGLKQKNEIVRAEPGGEFSTKVPLPEGNFVPVRPGDRIYIGNLYQITIESFETPASANGPGIDIAVRKNPRIRL